MRKFPGAVRSVGIFSQVDKKKVWKLHTSMCSKFFLNNQPFNYPGENLVKNFSERKDIDSRRVQIDGDITQQTFLVFQDAFSVTIFRLARDLEDVLQLCLENVLKAF